MSDFQVGEVVTLKSGGSKMTIEGIRKLLPNHEHPSARCTWSDEKNKPQEEWFLVTSLKKVE